MGESIWGLLLLFISAILILRWPFIGVVLDDLQPACRGPAAFYPANQLNRAGYRAFLPSRLSCCTTGTIQRKSPPNLEQLTLLGLLFIGWVYLSNPQAAIFGGDRNWIFTYFQLWVLSFFAGQLLDTPHKQRVLMWVFSVVSAFSAYAAVQQGFIGTDVDESLRASGFAQGSNAACGALLCGCHALLPFPQEHCGKQVARVVATLGVVITFLGVFFTVSRTGMVLLFAAVGLTFLLDPRRSQKFQSILLFLIGIVTLWLLSDSVFKSSIHLPGCLAGNGYHGVALQAVGGWLADVEGKHHPRGWIGVYPLKLRYYAVDLSPRYFSAVTHNTYLQVLFETGIVGFSLFMGMVTQLPSEFLAYGWKE